MDSNTQKETAWLLKEKYAGVESEAFHADCERLADGEPLAYIIGHVPFLDCQIWLDSHPLIPRPETEFWVERAINAILSTASDSGLLGFARNDGVMRVLDLCAGSGAIGVAVAKAIPQASVTFAEIDEAHLPTIKKNIETNLSANRKVSLRRLQVIQSDLFNSLPGAKEVKMLDEVPERFHLFDFILTNPPYIDAEANTVEDSVTAHEPHLALFGGEAGMEIIERIIVGARAKLAPQGQLWIEHEPAQAQALAKLAKEHGFAIFTHKDQYQNPRYSILTLNK